MRYTKPQKTLLQLENTDRKAYDDLYDLLNDYTNYVHEHGDIRLENWLRDTFEIADKDVEILQTFISNLYDFLY